jgi:hypothetical protein
MAYNTLANNHLSSAAQKGRRGDDRILQFSDGRIEHGNAFEEKLMGDAVGESLVDAIGSKTINPETGLKENWVSAVIMGLSALLGAGQAYSAGTIEEESAKQRAEASRAGLLDVQKSQENLLQSVQAERSLVGEEFGKKIDDFSRETGLSKGQIKETFTKAAGGTKLAYSGEVESAGEESINVAQERASSMQEGILGEYGKSLGQITASYEKSRAQLKSEESRFQRELELAKTAQESWYLGKNIRAWGDPQKFWS